MGSTPRSSTHPPGGGRDDRVLLALVLGAGVGLGLLLVAAGVAGRRALPEATPGGWAARGGRQPGHLVMRVGVAIGLAVCVYGVTGWPAASLLVAAAASVAPRALGGRQRHQAELAKVEAIASWAEMLRYTMAAASGLEQAMVASVAVAPAPIAPAVGRLAARLEHVRVPGALRAFADDVDHPIADFVVAGLIAAAEGRARELGPLLTQLAECARAEAQLRARIWAGRARRARPCESSPVASGCSRSGWSCSTARISPPTPVRLGRSPCWPSAACSPARWSGWIA